MIEYDKANITSSYPSLTPYEVATILDKAYLALIARKLTGNNTRRVPFEYDTKAVEDLQPLVTSREWTRLGFSGLPSNEHVYKISDDCIYYLEGLVGYAKDGAIVGEVASLVSHEVARRFKRTSSNMPWVPKPVTYLESKNLYLLVDAYKYGMDDMPGFIATYIKKPASFVENMDESSGGGNTDPTPVDPTPDDPTPDDPTPTNPTLVFSYPSNGVQFGVWIENDESHPIRSGNTVQPGAKLWVRITPTQGGVPTARINNDAIILEEETGNYNGWFYMPTVNSTLYISLTGGGDNPDQDTAELTIIHNGDGSCTVSAFGIGDIQSGDSVPINYTIWVGITSSQGTIPSASINNNSITLDQAAENTYFGTFQMPNVDSILTVNSGTNPQQQSNAPVAVFVTPRITETEQTTSLLDVTTIDDFILS